MKVAVVGAGVVGLTTAHYLHKAGANVHIFEREADVASQTSRANGAQLSYSFTDAMAAPELIPKLPRILLGQDPASVIRLSLRPAFIRWGWQFLMNCRNSRAQANSLHLLRLALRSAELMQVFHQQFGSDYCYQQAGKIVLLPNEPSATAKAFLQMKAKAGSDARYINFAEAQALEPALQRWATPAPAAIYSENDEVADAYRFATILGERLQADGVTINCGTTVQQLLSNGNRIGSIVTAADNMNVDAVVICTGHRCPELLAPLGVQVPIHPVAGYSITLPSVETSPLTSITALNKKIVFSRMGDKVRIAGFADINASSCLQQQRIQVLLQTARELAPAAANYAARDINPWTGFRPMTPDSLPIVGPSSLPGLYMNMGHGMLGWTLCAATSHDIARQVLANAA